jgi:hypothetical protein
MAKQSIQIVALCATFALCLWFARLGWLYDGWAWFWASLALHVCTWGWLLSLSRALRVGAVAGLAAFLSGVVQGADQGLPLIPYEWGWWPLLAAGMWAVGASFSYTKDRYWIETFCALLISCIYIYELVNEDNSLRVLIEIIFAAMLLLSIGGIGGRLVRNIRGYSFGRGPVLGRAHRASSMVAPQETVRKG